MMKWFSLSWQTTGIKPFFSVFPYFLYQCLFINISILVGWVHKENGIPELKGSLHYNNYHISYKRARHFMIRTTFSVIIKDIVQHLHQKKCKIIGTTPRLSYRATPTFLEGNAYSPRWHNGALCKSLGRHIW